MGTEKKRINFFCSLAEMDKLHNTLELEDDGAYFDSSFTVDVIDFPFLLFYSSNRDSCQLQINTRFDTYKHEEDNGKKEAEIIAPKGGGLQGHASDNVQQVVAPFMIFCMKLAKYAQINDLQGKYGSMDPEKEGILLEAMDSGLEYRIVSGAERPDMMCMTLSGNAKMTRPYEEDLRKKLLLDVMPLEMKEKMAETGNADMMEYMFNYYMGTAERPHAELMSASKKLHKVLGEMSGEGTDAAEEEPEEDTRNPEKAFYWLKKMAESGNTDAMYKLAMFYAKGYGTERDFRKTAEWMKKLCEEGIADEDEEKYYLEVADYKEKAEAGDAEAQSEYVWKLLSLAVHPGVDIGKEEDNKEAYQWAKKSAAQAYPKGMHMLGLIYQNGLGIEKDEGKAFRLFERAAEKGYAESQNKLGEMYFGGQGTEKDPAKAFEWTMKAAQQGVPKGMQNVGVLYLYGFGVEKDTEQAKYWLKKAAELGDENAEQMLNQIGSDNEPDKGDGEQQTLEKVQKDAEQGSVQAMKMLANYYVKRPGGREDLHEAYKWAQKAAELGDEESKNLCQQLESFFNGETASFEEVRNGAENGDALAQKILADYYATGYKTQQDLVKALYWMKKAAAFGDARFAEQAQGFVDTFTGIEEILRGAEADDPHAQAQLAEKYAGISQNYPDYNQKENQEAAFKMAEKATASGDPLGMFVLGVCYENGYGTEVDFDKAFELYKRSAEQGNPKGELSLSQCYLTRHGTEIDAEAAMEWLEKAEKHGNPDASQARDMYRQLMPMIAMDKLGDGANSGGPDPVQGARLMERAAELGSAEAQGFLGMMYINGNHVENDFETGILWLQKAAENGNQQAAGALDKYDRPEAYNAAANMEFAKKELADKEKVFRLVKHAAEGGLAISQNTLGLLYMNAVGVNPDYNTAMEWFQKAADQGNENAIQNIRKYRTPDGMYFGAIAKFTVNRKMGITDSTDAFELLEKAANAGSPEGLNMLGVFYADPKGIATQFGVTCEEDLEKAKSLFEKALSLKPDLVHAEKNLTKLADLKEAKETGREPNAELKWQIALKKMNAGTNVQTAEAGSPSNRESKQDGEAASEEDHIPEGQTETDASVTNEPQAESASEQKIITEPDETSDSEDEIERELWTAAEANRIAAFGKVGETVCFGRYIQEKQDSPEDIEWIVLDTDGDRSLLISRYALDSLAFQEGGTDGTWETSSLRKWLNEDFLRTAFSEAELKAVAETDTSEGDAQTTDRVFLFSGKEISDVYPFDTRRICRAAPYAAFRGAHVDEAGNCWWWLRSPGRNPGEALAVDAQGEIRSVDADNQDCAVRPAIWIQREHLSSLTKADLSSYGEEEEEQETEQGVRETLYRIKDTFDVDNPESEMHQQSAEIDTPLISSRNKKIRTIAIALIILAMAVSACSGLKLF